MKGVLKTLYQAMRGYHLQPSLKTLPQTAGKLFTERELETVDELLAKGELEEALEKAKELERRLQELAQDNPATYCEEAKIPPLPFLGRGGIFFGSLKALGAQSPPFGVGW